MTQKNKKYINELHDKFYGKGAKAKKENARLAKAIKERKEGIKYYRILNVAQPNIETTATTAPATPKAIETGDTRPTVNDLRYAARKEGIKYYRILNKEELVAVLCMKTEDNEAEITKITEAAKARWKAGWGKGKKQ